MSKRYKNIILHVGMHKTGSTSIQNNCQFQHHDLLLEHGIKYASFRCNGRLKANHSGPVSAALFDDPDTYGVEWRMNLDTSAEQARREYREYFDDILANPQSDTLLLSGESFSIYRPPHLHLLREQLLQHTDRLRVVVYVRSPLGQIESMMQQRTRAGAAINPDSLLGLIPNRILVLKEVFGSELEPQNYDEAASSPLGLVGSFLKVCGVPEHILASLQYSVANTRCSLEAFWLMRAINQRYPNQLGSKPANGRSHNDLNPLYNLPGARFGLYDFTESPEYASVIEEKAWLEEALGFKFSDEVREAPEDTWSFATLAALEHHLRMLENSDLRAAAADFLQREAERLQADRPETTAVLTFITRRLNELDTLPPTPAVQALGAPYFRMGAQQVRHISPELALRLLRVAREFQPKSSELDQQIDELEKLLGDS